MKHVAQCLVARRGLVLGLLAAFASVALATRSPTFAQSTSTASLVGTIRAVDHETRVLELITAVGHATRVVRLKVAADCRITIPQGAAHLTNIVPGTVARIDYVPAPAAAPPTVYGVVVKIEGIDVDAPVGTR